MATVTELTTPPLSGYNHIDALLNKSPQWNFSSSRLFNNTITYTFAVSGNKPNSTTVLDVPVAFTAEQQAGARTALAYIASVTGIQFQEVAATTGAGLRFGSADLEGNTIGVELTYGTPVSGAPEPVNYNPYSIVVLDNKDFASRTADLTPGGRGYEVLLHELGHALGLKHPHEGDIVLPIEADDRAHSVMTYNKFGANLSAFSEYDLAALKWLYGGDGLGGLLGVGASSGGRYLVGTSAADQLTGSASADVLEGGAGNDQLDGGLGNDQLDGGTGIDTAIYSGARSAYQVAQLGAGGWSVTGTDGVDTLSGIEWLRFSDVTLALAASDTVAPLAPGLAFLRDSVGARSSALSGNRPVLSGSAEAGAQVEVLRGQTVLATVQTGADGKWSYTPLPQADGELQFAARASDAAGNLSAVSALASVTVSSTRNLKGTAEADRLSATNGDNHIAAGAGTDTVVYAGQRGDYRIEKTAAGFLVYDTEGSGGTDVLVDSERLVFADKTVAIDIDGVAGQAYRLYQAAFDRAPDTGGLGYWIAQMDRGATLRDVAGGFMGSPEFARLYGGANPANADFVLKLYGNVLHRAPDAEGQAYWVDILGNNRLSKAEVLAQFAESPENVAQLASVIGSGVEYTPYL